MHACALNTGHEQDLFFWQSRYIKAPDGACLLLLYVYFLGVL